MGRVQNNRNDDNDRGNGNGGRPAAVPAIILPAEAALIGRSIFVRHRESGSAARGVRQIAFAAICLSWNEREIQHFRAFHKAALQPIRRLPDEWRRTTNSARSPHE
jgi:hypothetical protein